MFVQSFNLHTPSDNQLQKTIDVDELNQTYSIKYKTQLDTVLFTSQQQLRNNATNDHDNNACNVLLCGNDRTLITNARGDILRNSPIKSTITINSPNQDAIFHPEIKPSLIQIAQTYHIEIKLHYQQHQHDKNNCQQQQRHHRCAGPEIHLFGCVDSLEAARVEVLVLLDRLSGLLIDRIDDIPHHFHYLIAGRKHSQLQSIMQETATNIYLRSPFSHLLCNEEEKSQKKMHEATIFFSGESASSLNRAKELLKSLYAHMMTSVFVKESQINPRKLDWVLLNKHDELRKIMMDNGSFFSFPALGSGSNSVSVYAENRIHAERSIRLLNHLSSSIYEATFKFVENNSLQELNNLSLVLAQYALASGAEISYDSETYSMYLLGTECQVKKAYDLTKDLDFFHNNHKYTIFSVELATDQREFVSGKKNGKINKIMKSCTASIRFTISNEYNSAIIVESDDSAKAMEGLCMLQDELPAETSFYVPEVYHRRIIGVGGKNIQKVMKQYGVYVKFSNKEEFKSMGGYFENEDNVVARTPMKNKTNLDHLREAVTTFIAYDKDRNYISATMKVPYPLQRIISSRFAQQLRDVCQANSTMIWWPERLGTDDVTVYGPQAQLPLVISYVQQFIDIEKHVVIAVKNNCMEKTLTDSNFAASIQQQLVTDCPNIELKNVELIKELNYRKEGVLEWNYDYPEKDCDRIVVFRLLCHTLLRQGHHYLQAAKDTIKKHIESAGFSFEDLGNEDDQECFHNCHYKQVAVDPHFALPATSLSGLNDQSYHHVPLLNTSLFMSNTANTNVPNPNNSNVSIGGMPSPPLSETFASTYPPHHHQHQQQDTSSHTTYHQQHHNTLFGRVNGVLPPPTFRRNYYNNTFKNIWAAPLLPPGGKSFAPFFGPGLERMSVNPSFQRPLSPPQQQPRYHQPSLSPSQSAFQSAQPVGSGSMFMKPSTSTPVIGPTAAAHEFNEALSPEEKELQDASWPDVFLGGRDLFSTLRTSWSTPYGQRHYF